MTSKLTFSNITTIILLLVTILSFIFGNKITDYYGNAKLVFSTTKAALNFPSNIILKNLYIKDQIVPDAYRKVVIRNIGSKPSKNLKIQIILDGKIVDSKVQSIEDFKKTDKSETEILITMSRLAANAEITLDSWIKQGLTDLSIKAIDEHGSFEVIPFSTVKETYYLEIILGVFFSILVFVILYQWLLKPRNEKISILKNNIEKLQKINQILASERDQLLDQLEDTNTQENELESDTLSKLKVLLEKANKDTKH